MVDELKLLHARAESDKFTTYASCMMKDDNSSDVKVKVNSVWILIIIIIIDQLSFSLLTFILFSH